MTYDLIVIGAGIAGSSLARREAGTLDPKFTSGVPLCTAQAIRKPAKRLDRLERT
jgi:flavin-dependent dehydrogenase